MPDRPLLVVDGDNLAHRAYHSTPKSVVDREGRPFNAISGFFSMLGRIWSEEKPRAVFVGWDTLGVDTYRNRLWPAYQTGRQFDREIVEQLNRLPDFCAAFGLGYGKAAGYEADDLMAAAVHEEVDRGGNCLVFTTDKDSYQLVSDRVTVISPQRGTRELARVTPTGVVERFGVLPEQVPAFKALSGDASDKIPGIRGIGPKAASALLLKHGTLENVVTNWAEKDAQLALMFREVATMQPSVPVELPNSGPDWESGAALLRENGAEGLADRLHVLINPSQIT